MGAWHEKDLTLANFRPVDGGYHVVANETVAALLPPGLLALDRTRTADEVGLPETLINTDKNNFSPRVGFAWRLDESSKTVLRGGFGLFHPTVAVQGIRDLLATNEFRFVNTTTGGGLRNGFSGGTPTPDLAAFGNQGIDPNLQSPDIYQYNLTLEHELTNYMGLRVSYIGSTMRKLLVDRDYNTLQASTVPFDPENPADYARLPFPLYGYYMDIVSNAGSGQYHSAQLELLRRWRNGLAFNVAYTLANSESNAPDTGNSTIGPVQFDPYDIEKDRGPDPNVVKHRVVANATWDIPVGRNRAHGASMAKWADALFGGWTVSSIVQARSGQNLTPFFSGFYTTSPWNTGKPLDGLGNFFCCALAAGSDRQSQQRWAARSVLQSSGVRHSRPGPTWKRQERQPEGPGHVGGELRVLQGRDPAGRFPAAVLGSPRQCVQPPAVLPDVWERVRRSHVVLGRRGARQRHNRCVGRRRYRKRRRVCARAGRAPRFEGDVLEPSAVLRTAFCHRRTPVNTDQLILRLPFACHGGAYQVR